MCIRSLSPAVPRVSGSMRLTYSSFFSFITHFKLHPLTDESKERESYKGRYLFKMESLWVRRSVVPVLFRLSPLGSAALLPSRGRHYLAPFVLTLHPSAPRQETLTITALPFLLLLLSEALESRLIAPLLDPRTPPTLVKRCERQQIVTDNSNVELQL